MRHLGILIFTAASMQALACPDLTGNYTCTYQDGSVETVTFSQGTTNGTTTYTYNGSRIPTDNYSYYLPDDENLKWRYFRAWCDADLFQTQLNGQYYREGNYYGYFTNTTTFSRTASNGLKISTTSWLKSSGGEFPMNSEMNCSRKSPF